MAGIIDVVQDALLRIRQVEAMIGCIRVSTNERDMEDALGGVELFCEMLAEKIERDASRLRQQ